MYYPKVLIEVLKKWRDMKVWRGSIEERKEKFRWLHEQLKQIYNVPEDLSLEFGEITGKPGSSGASYYDPVSHTIYLTGRLSVITYLHEFAHALGFNQEYAVKWSMGLFKLIFPKSYSRLVNIGNGLVVSSRDIENMEEGGEKNGGLLRN